MHRAWNSFYNKFLGTFIGRCIFGVVLSATFGGTTLWFVLELTLGGYIHAVQTIGDELKGVKVEIAGIREDLSKGDIPSMNFQINAIKSDIKAEFADMKSDMSHMIDEQVFDAIHDLKLGQEAFLEEIRSNQSNEP